MQPDPRVLLALYDRAADAPDAVSRLRRFVLGLAVRGKLAPQDLSADDASWKVYTLAQLEQRGIVQLGRGKVISKKDLSRTPGSYPVYSSSKIGDGKFGEYGKYMFDEELITWSVDGGGRLFHRHKHKFSITNVTGFLRILQPTIVDYKYLFYCLVFLHSKVNFDWVKKAHPSVLRREYNHIFLPPLEEQQRIVAKVDELMALCDRLEKTRTAREETRDRLTKAGLARLSAPDTDDATFRSHARFAVDIFPALTARADQVKHLRRTILDLAMRGKLAPQDLSADDASWKTVKIGDILALIQNGINCRQNKSGDGFKITRIETIASSVINFQKTGFAALDERQQVKAKLDGGDILFSHINSPVHIGKTAIYSGQEPLYHGINLLRLKTIPEVLPTYFNYFLNGLFRSGYWVANSKKSVNQASVNQSDIKRLPFSYPPPAEQQRIVAKVDELMSLCDRLEAGLDTVAKGRERLLESVVRDALEPAVSERAG